MSQDLAAGLPAGPVGTWVALVGALVGSFLNVVIARVPAGLSVVHPRSRCPRCLRPIAWYDNVPVLSWILLRARCRGCHLPISIRYPLVELLVAGVALLCWWRHGLSLAALLEFAFAAMLVALAAIDLDTWLLPNALTWPLVVLGLAGAALGETPASTLASAAVGAALGFAFFGAIWAVGEWILKKEAMGFGDVWLLAGLAGWFGPKGLLPIVLLASTQGAVFGIVQIALGRGQPGREPGPASGPASAAPPTGAQAAGASAAPPAKAPAGGKAVGAAAGAEAEDEDDWVPPRHAVPFGPFLVLGALEWLWAGGWLAGAVGLFEVFR